MKRSLLLLPALFLAGLASAQDAFDFHVADVGLLQAKSVQTDVGITAAERAKMNAAAAEHRGRLQAYEKQLKALGAVAPDKAKLRGFFEILKKEVISDITPAQLRRLRELTLQRIGLVSLTDDTVAKKVGLSGGQVGRLKSAFETGRTKFIALQQATAKPIVAPYQGKKPKDQAQAAQWNADVQAKLKAAGERVKPQLVAIGKGTDAAMMAVLTPAQRATWNALKGKPFKGK